MKLARNFCAAGAILLAGVALSLPQALAREGARKLTPEESQKARQLYKDAYSHLTNKEYAKSNEGFEQLLKLLPAPAESRISRDRNQVLYNMACNHAMLGEKEQSLARLEQAVESGFWNHEFLSRDPSLESVRGETRFKQAVEASRQVIRGLPFELTDLEGKSLKKEDLKDKVLVIDIWGTWCPPCVMEIPHFVKLQEKYGKDGLQVVGLAYEKREPDENVRRRVATFARDRNINYPLLFPSPEMLALLNVSSFPTTLYLGRDGVVRKRVTGYADLGAMEETVKPLLAEKPAASPPTN